jgi:hypothetical protein
LEAIIATPEVANETLALKANDMEADENETLPNEQTRRADLSEEPAIVVKTKAEIGFES